MSCIIDEGYVLGCATTGGVEKVWIGTWDINQSYAYNICNTITGVTSGITLYEIEQDIEYAGINQNGQFSRENGSVFYESILSLKFIELTCDLRNLIVALGRAPIFAVVKSNAGAYYAAGVESAGRATAGVMSLGVALGDMNGATLEITWKSANGIYLIDGALIGTSLPVAP
jgi:hypothetical protein